MRHIGPAYVSLELRGASHARLVAPSRAIASASGAFFSELRVEKDELKGKKRTQFLLRVAKLSSFPSCELRVAKKRRILWSESI